MKGKFVTVGIREFSNETVKTVGGKKTKAKAFVAGDKYHLPLKFSKKIFQLAGKIAI